MRLLVLALWCSCFHAALLPAQSFPAAWAGTYQGTLEVYTAAGRQMAIPMQLELSASDTNGQWHYRLTYGADTSDVRPYLLIPRDTSQGHYLVDERNGILLDAWLFGGALYQCFDVGESRLMLSLRPGAEAGTLIWEIAVWPLSAAHISGDTLIDDAQIPAVGSYTLRAVQRAHLQRIR